MGSPTLGADAPAVPVVAHHSAIGAGAASGAATSPARRVAMVATLALCLIPLALLSLLAFSVRGHVLPQVRVADVPVGGLPVAEAYERVETRVAALAGQPITLALGDRTWTPLPAELGIAYDVAASVDAAMAHGRERDRLAGLLRAARLARDPVTVPLAVTFDQAPFDAYLDRLDAAVGQAPVDASVTIAGTDVTVVPARDGRGIDRAAARAALAAQIARLQPVSVALAERTLPAVIGTDQAAAAKAIVDRALAEPIALTLADEVWRIAPEELARLARVAAAERDGRRLLTTNLDETALQAFVAGLAMEIDAPTSDARVEDLGTHQRLVPAVRGRTLRRDELARTLQEAFAAGVHAVPLPVTPTGPEPGITTEALLADLGVTDLVATGDSDFAGSDPGRTANVHLAASRVDGTLVPPGGAFSFNAALGSLFDSGFVAADATIDGAAETAEGGGVCQVSTTVFRAALRAGLPIVEWWPHNYRSPFYEQGGWSPGFDASIVQVWGDPAAGTDFRFENPTESWLLVRVAVHNETSLRVELHGTNPGYIVRLDEPVSEATEGASEAVVEIDPALPPGSVVEDQPAADGITVTVVRYVTDAAGNEISTDTFVSPYRPRGAVVRAGPDAAEAAAPGG